MKGLFSLCCTRRICVGAAANLRKFFLKKNSAKRCWKERETFRARTRVHLFMERKKLKTNEFKASPLA